jgi:RND family efflux transporter MFP subunit
LDNSEYGKTSMSNTTPNTLRYRIILPALILGGALLLYGLLVGTQPELTHSKSQRQPTTIRATTVITQPHTLRVNAQGTARATTETSLIAQVPGEVIWVSPSLRAGGHFNQGETLFKVDARDLSVQQQKALASLVRAQAELKYADSELNRLKALIAKEMASDSALAQAERAQAVASAATLNAEADLDQAERNLERATIVAPFNGRVKSEYIDLGQFLQPGKVVADIYNSDSMEVRIPLPDSQLAYLNTEIMQAGVLLNNQSAPVTLWARFGGARQEWQGRLVRTDGEIQAKSRMLNVIVSIEKTVNKNGVALPAGLFLNALIEGNTLNDAVLLPRSAIRNNSQVLIVNDDQTLHFRDVEILRFEEDQAVITAGLRPGETVCVSPLQYVVEGMPVSVLE